MSNCPFDIGGVTETIGAATSTSSGTALATTWTQLSAATGMQYDGFFLNVHDGTTADTLIDVGIGAAAAEQALIEDIYLCAMTSDGYQNGGSIFIPIKIPKGARVVARSTQAISADIVGVKGSAGFMSGFSGALTFGASATRGTQISGNASANTKGAWTEMSSSIGKSIRALMLCVGRNGNSSIADAEFLFDIGLGTAGSEQVIVSNLPATTDSVRDIIIPRWFGPFPFSIPAATRLAARLQTTTTDASDRNMDGILYGFY